MLVKSKNYEDLKERVNQIKSTENSYYVKSMNQAKRRNLFDPYSYSSFGLSACGTRLGFPGNFISKYMINHPENASRVLKDHYQDRISEFLESDSSDKRKSNSLFIRDFNGVHYGVLTDKYAVFDDDEVVSIISKNKYLMDAEEFWYDISPERFHARFVSKKKLYIDGDDSPLSMCVFVDNSMCGASSFRIRFGIYRWACTNGMIAGLKSFEIVKEHHKGMKDYVQIVASALENVEQYEKMLIKMVEDASTTKSQIYNLTEEQALAYIQKSLNVGKKASIIIFENYKNYGGKSKWDLTNAITDYAHHVDVNNRVMLETRALQVA